MMLHCLFVLLQIQIKIEEEKKGILTDRIYLILFNPIMLHANVYLLQLQDTRKCGHVLFVIYIIFLSK